MATSTALRPEEAYELSPRRPPSGARHDLIRQRQQQQPPLVLAQPVDDDFEAEEVLDEGEPPVAPTTTTPTLSTVQQPCETFLQYLLMALAVTSWIFYTQAMWSCELWEDEYLYLRKDQGIKVTCVPHSDQEDQEQFVVVFEERWGYRGMLVNDQCVPFGEICGPHASSITYVSEDYPRQFAFWSSIVGSVVGFVLVLYLFIFVCYLQHQLRQPCWLRPVECCCCVVQRDCVGIVTLYTILILIGLVLYLAELNLGIYSSSSFPIMLWPMILVMVGLVFHCVSCCVTCNSRALNLEE